MHAMVRTYSGSGATQLFDALEMRKAEIEAAIRAVPGLVSFTMLRTSDGGVTVTVCADKSGADDSLRIAREWMQANVPHVTVDPPGVAEGSVVVLIK